MIIPTIGSSGFFELRAPFDTKILQGERYTCQAVRKLSDYLANNETPLDDVYKDAGLTEADYDADLLLDMYILSLQADTGHWVYVPASYLVKLPIVNGIPYRSMMIGVSLPALPADKDLSNVLTSIENLVMETLGVASATKVVETSKVVLIDRSTHDLTQSQRDANTTSRLTDRSKYTSTLTQLQAALLKIEQLESYIESLPP